MPNVMKISVKINTVQNINILQRATLFALQALY